jgi:TRAP-type uncharacterized transport system substrate-binding protein
VGFLPGSATPSRLDELRGRRIAIGAKDQGVHAFVEPLLAANGVTANDSELVPIGNLEALHALQAGTVDAAMFVGGAESPAVVAALHDKSLKLMNFSRAEAYQRRFDHITKLTLPAGTVDFALDIPQDDVALIATEAMLVSRDDIPPAIITLLHEAAREVHSDQGYFEKPREFPTRIRSTFPCPRTPIAITGSDRASCTATCRSSSPRSSSGSSSCSCR